MLVADCLSLDLQLDSSKGQGDFDHCREPMALKVLERKDGKQFNLCPYTDEEDIDRSRIPSPGIRIRVCASYHWRVPVLGGPKPSILQTNVCLSCGLTQCIACLVYCYR